MSNSDFTEISKAKIQEKRNLVISKNRRNGITLAQQIVVEEGSKKTFIFIKGAIFVDRDKLLDLRDALNEAIVKLDDED